MKPFVNILNGVLICSFIGLAFFSSPSNASTFVNIPTPTTSPTSDSQAPFVSEPVSPSTSPRVDSLPTAEPQRDGPIREINPRQNPNEQADGATDQRGTDTITDTSEIQAPQVSEPVTPSLSSPVYALSTAVPPSDGAIEDEEIEEINPRQNPNRLPSRAPHSCGN